MIWGSLSSQVGRNETLLKGQERQSWDVQVGTETDVRRRCVDGDRRGKNRYEEWGKACYEIWGPELIAEQDTAEVYGWLLWVNLNLCILRCSTHANEFRCSKITEMEVLRDRSLKTCSFQRVQTTGSSNGWQEFKRIIKCANCSYKDSVWSYSSCSVNLSFNKFQAVPLVLLATLKVSWVSAGVELGPLFLLHHAAPL